MSVAIQKVAPRPAVREWSERHGFSPPLVARWVEFLPEPKRLLASFLRPVPRYLRLNPIRTDAARLESALTARGFVLTPVPAPDPRVPAWRIDKEPFAVSSTPEHLDGWCYLQDLASLTAPAALAPEPGDLILDMAAAPGGKTAALAAATGDAAPIVAVEPVAERAAALTANLRRLGIRAVGVRHGRGEEVPGEAVFDRILLDAPCTGEGVLPRDPARRKGSLDEHLQLATLQRALIDAGVRLLRPGGTLVYSTCTFAPEECEEAVGHAVARGLEPEPLPFADLGGIPLSPPLDHAGPRRYGEAVRHARRAYPNVHKTLGFFVARLRKPHDWDPALLPAGVPAAPVGVGIGAFSASDEEPVTPAVPAGAVPPPEATLRGLDPPEVEAFDAMLTAYGDGIRDRLEATGMLKVVERQDTTPHRRIVWTRRDDVAALAPFRPFWLGMPIATLSRKGARLTLEGGRAIAAHATRRCVRIEPKGEQLFLYGRHVLGKSLARVDRPVEADDDVLVLAVDGRYLGLGRADPFLATRRPGGEEAVVHPVADLGLYLRAQQAVPE